MVQRAVFTSLFFFPVGWVGRTREERKCQDLVNDWLKERTEILVEGAKLKFVLNARNELEILGNRKGLGALAAHLFGAQRIRQG